MMDCCNYGEYRGPQYSGAGGGRGAGGGWEGYAPYAPLPYAPYTSPYYTPHAHDPYARYYRYEYNAHNALHTDHVLPIDYGAYASKESRVRRALARRDARAHTPTHHLPIPHTPQLECGMNGRGAAYCEPQMWSHYQVGMMGGAWSGASAMSAWQRGQCARDAMRYSADCRPLKSPHVQAHNQIGPQDGRSTPYPTYDDISYGGNNRECIRPNNEFPAPTAAHVEPTRSARDPIYSGSRSSPPEEKKPPVVPLPAFQQAFGSTEIGKFAEAFSRTEIALEDSPGDIFAYDSYSEWEGASEPQWSSQPISREIKCEDNY